MGSADLFSFLTQQAKNYGGMMEKLYLLPPLTEQDWGMVLKAWEHGGLLGLGYNPNGSIRSWVNVCTHQIVVAGVGYRVAKALEAPLTIEGFTPSDVCLALLVHDWNKQRDILKPPYAKAITRSSIREEALENAVELCHLGFSKPVALITAATTQYGTDEIWAGRSTLACMVAWYADLCVADDRQVTFLERLEQLQKKFLPGEDYQFWVDYFEREYDTPSHAEIWGDAGKVVAKRFGQYLGLHDFLGKRFLELPLAA